MTSSAWTLSPTLNVAIWTLPRAASVNAADFRSLSMSCTFPFGWCGEVEDAAAVCVEGRPFPGAGVGKVTSLGLNLGPVALQRQRGSRTAGTDLVGEPVQPPQHIGLSRL